MAQNFKQRGDILQYTNTGSADVASEELIVFGALAGRGCAGGHPGWGNRLGTDQRGVFPAEEGR